MKLQLDCSFGFVKKVLFSVWDSHMGSGGRSTLQELLAQGAGPSSPITGGESVVEPAFGLLCKLLIV